MASKRGRASEDEHVGWESYTKHGRQEPGQIVNGLSLMMQAAKALSQRAQGASQQPGQSSQLFPCTHCGRQLPESQLSHCSHCLDIFCSTCSVPNYDAHEDRTFCLECNTHQGSQPTPRYHPPPPPPPGQCSPPMWRPGAPCRLTAPSSPSLVTPARCWAPQQAATCSWAHLCLRPVRGRGCSPPHPAPSHRRCT